MTITTITFRLILFLVKDDCRKMLLCKALALRWWVETRHPSGFDALCRDPSTQRDPKCAEENVGGHCLL